MYVIKRFFQSCLFSLLVASSVIFAADESTDSPYRKAGNIIFISSQAPIDPISHQVVSGDATKQVKQVFDNLREQVVASGASMQDVVKITVYMDDIDLIFPIVKKYIPIYFSAPYPARSPVAGLKFGSSGIRVAIDAVLYVQ